MANGDSRLEYCDKANEALAVVDSGVAGLSGAVLLLRKDADAPECGESGVRPGVDPWREVVYGCCVNMADVGPGTVMEKDPRP